MQLLNCLSIYALNYLTLYDNIASYCRRLIIRGHLARGFIPWVASSEFFCWAKSSDRKLI